MSGSPNTFVAVTPGDTVEISLRGRLAHQPCRLTDNLAETRKTMNLPSDSLGVVAYAADDLRVEPVSLREPAEDQAVIEVAYGGMCGSDLHYWMHGAAGDSILRAPMVLGHEVVGTVVQAAGDGSGPGPGTSVAVHRRPRPVTASPGTRRTDRTCRRAAPISAAPPGSRIPTELSSSTRPCPLGCSGRCPPGSACATRHWSSRLRWPGTRWPGRAT